MDTGITQLLGELTNNHPNDLVIEELCRLALSVQPRTSCVVITECQTYKLSADELLKKLQAAEGPQGLQLQLRKKNQELECAYYEPNLGVYSGIGLVHPAQLEAVKALVPATNTLDVYFVDANEPIFEEPSGRVSFLVQLHTHKTPKLQCLPYWAVFRMPKLGSLSKYRDRMRSEKERLKLAEEEAERKKPKP